MVAALSTALRVGANLALLPIILTGLSQEDQALWWVFVALSNFANLADFGFGQSIARVYSYLWAGAEDFDAEGLRPVRHGNGPNFVRIHELTLAVEHLYVRLSLCAAIVLAICGTAFLWRDFSQREDTVLLWACWAGQLVVIAYGLATCHWMFAIQGVNRVREMQKAYLWSSLAFLVAAAVLLSAGLGLSSMVIATGLRVIMMFAFARSTYSVVLPSFDRKLVRLDLGIVTRLWPNAKKFGILSIGGYCLNNVSVLVSSRFLGAPVTASVGLTQQVGTFLMSFATLWTGVKWPEITMLRAQGRLREMSALFAQRLMLVLTTFASLALVVYLAGNSLLEWKGTETRLLPSAQLAVYLVYLGLRLNYEQFGLLALTENVVPFFKVGLATGLLLLVLSYFMTSWFGLWGLVLAPLVAESVYSNWFTIRRGFQGQPLSIGGFLRAGMFMKS